MGLMVVESPIPESRLEGCIFYVGAQSNDRPCIFVNTHHSTWFRRNEVLMHETGHAIFDADSSGASLDFVNTDHFEDLQEQRAQAFAQESLVPKEVICHIGQEHGMNWAKLASHQLAILVAEIQVELQTILKAALDAGLIDAIQMEGYSRMEISSELKSLTDRALSAEEYIHKIGNTEAEKWISKENKFTQNPSSAGSLYQIVLERFRMTDKTGKSMEC
jgi:Zn-dependent peptidase ImmA (M78 family)